MLTAQEARQNLSQKSSQQEELQKQIEKSRLEGLLAQAVQEEINQNSLIVMRSLDRGSDVQAKIIREILEEKGFKNILVAHKYEVHNKHVDSWVDIKFSF